MFLVHNISRQPNRVYREMTNLMGFSLIDSTAKEVEKTLIDFYNVGRLCLDCKSKLHLNSKQRTGKMGFPDWWRKTKTKNKNQNPLTNKVKVRFKPGSWSAGSATNQARSWAGSSNIDWRPWSSADDREAQPSRGCSEASMEILECRGLVIQRGNECSDEEQRRDMFSFFFFFWSILKN